MHHQTKTQNFKNEKDHIFTKKKRRENLDSITSTLWLTRSFLLLDPFLRLLLPWEFSPSTSIGEWFRDMVKQWRMRHTHTTLLALKKTIQKPKSQTKQQQSATLDEHAQFTHHQSPLFMRFLKNTKHSLTSVLFCFVSHCVVFVLFCAVLCCCVEFDHLFHLYSHMKLAAANYNPLFPGLSESFALIGPRWYFVRNIPRGTRAWFWEGGSVRRL